MKLIREMAHIVFWSWLIVAAAYIRLTNPELTETQLFIKYQWEWVSLSILAIFYTMLIILTVDKQERDKVINQD